MRPLILITNDDGVNAKGLRALYEVAAEFGDVIVMAPDHNRSGVSHSITSSRPIRVHKVSSIEGLTIYSCDGRPVDCVKLAFEHFCTCRPKLVLSGINHGSNSSINILYSGTMGAVLEATMLGLNSIGFSLLNHSPEADFTHCLPYIRQIIGTSLEKGLPKCTSLNVNIPSETDLKGIRICHQAQSQWVDSFEQRIDPRGVPYWWLTGKFICDNPPEGTDEWALANGYVAITPVHIDYTNHAAIATLKKDYSL